MKHVVKDGKLFLLLMPYYAGQCLGELPSGVSICFSKFSNVSA